MARIIRDLIQAHDLLTALERGRLCMTKLFDEMTNSAA